MGNQVRGSSTHYVQCVVGYLLSPLGQSTCDGTARRLLALDPRSIGMPAEPSSARLHAIRAFLDAAFAPDNDQGMPGEVTGVYSLASRAAASA